MSITVNLPSYNYSLTFNRSEFFSLFPDSLIAITFTNPEEKEVDIINSLVTPYVLQYINLLVENPDEVPSSPSQDLTPASRYLLMPILGVLSNLKYDEFIQQYSYIDLLDINYLKQDYGVILNYSLKNNFPLLTNYLLERVNPEDYPIENLLALLISANRNNMSMFQYFLKIVPDPTAELNINDIKVHLEYEPYGDLLEYVDEYLANIDSIQASALGKANTILRYLSSDPRFQNIQQSWNQSLYISALSDNYEGIDIIRPLASQVTIDHLLDEEIQHSCIHMVGHLILPLGTDVTIENIMIYALQHHNETILRFAMSNMKPDDILQVIRGNINLVRGNIVNDIVDSKFYNDEKFATTFYNILLENKHYSDLPYFSLIPYRDDDTIWTDTLSGISVDELRNILTNENIPFSSSSYLISIARNIGRDDLIPIIQQANI